MTPSARRVRVDSSPMSASPLQYLRTAIAAATASSRAYPDAQREVWELSLWDPKSFNLTLFTLFSPGHVLFYYVLLPPAILDPRPSVTVLTAIAFGGLLSFQLSILKSHFQQQAKDSALIHGQVMNEYDTKFVRPTLHHPVRDVGIQTRESARSARGARTREVDVYTPTTIVNRGFHVNPNPNYSAQYDPDSLSASTPTTTTVANSLHQQSAHHLTRQILQTPTTSASTPYSRSTAATNPITNMTTTAPTDHYSSPLKPHHERPRDRPRDGGYLGVYSHAASPLKPQPPSSARPYSRAETSTGTNTRLTDSAVRRSTSTSTSTHMRTPGASNGGGGGGGGGGGVAGRGERYGRSRMEERSLTRD